MKKSFVLAITLVCSIIYARAQKSAMDFQGEDCAGNVHHLFEDLDAGKAVLLHFFMDGGCGSCPPPAKKIQAMANHILESYPGSIKAYAFPYLDNITCAYTASWVSSNNLSLYIPMDSGKAQLAHYGGFGMPTIVLLGGKDHRVMFSTLSFETSDTTLMRDSILALLGVTSVQHLDPILSSVSVYPSPAHDQVEVALQMRSSQQVKMELVNLVGQRMRTLYEGVATKGDFRHRFGTADLATGIYFVRLQSGQQQQVVKFSVSH